MPARRKLAAILAADVVGFSRLANFNEDRTLARLRALRSDLVDPTISIHFGRLIKNTGDGALVEFRSVVDAVRCGLEIQAGMLDRNAGLAPEMRIELRIGIHLGDVVEESDGDLMGDGVNIAARLEGAAAPNTICLSEDAYRQVKSRLELDAIDLGEISLKNIAEPVRAYCLTAGGVAGAKPATGPESTPPGASPEAPALPANPSIAVLAFQNMSGDADQEYFSDGISEDIITDLSKLANLHVVARNSSFVYKQKAVSIPVVARELGVRFVLEGSVRKAGARIRVNAQLIDAQSGGHIWANRFDRELNDIFAVQDELTQEIVSALKLKLTLSESGRLTHDKTASVEAYELLLRSRGQSMLLTRAGNIATRALAEAALAIDPQLAEAYALMAFAHLNDYANGYGGDPADSLRKGRELADRAVGMDANDPACRLALGTAWSWSGDLDRAIAQARLGLSLAPNSAPLMLLLAGNQIYASAPAPALETVDALIRVDPHYADIALQFIAEARFSLKQYELAIAAIEQRLKRNPESETAFALLASCYGWMDRKEEARLAWDETLRLKPDFSVERRRKVLPFKNPEDFEQRVEGWRRAGLKF